MRILTVDHRARRRARDVPAVRAAIGAWAAIGLLFACELVIPGADRRHAGLVLVAAVLALAWAALLAVLPARRSLIPLFIAGALLGMLLMHVVVAATGGSVSPLRVLPVVVIVYCTWFFDPRTALMVTAGTLGLHLLPLAYDPDALRAPGLDQTIVIGGSFVLTAALMRFARRELVALRDTARAEALRDPLTDLANRRALMAFLERAARGGRVEDRIGLVLLDLDAFKAINTRHGHGGGDDAIVAAADALRAAAREHDLVARLGGDEFAIVLPGAAARDADAVARRAVAAVSAAGADLALEGVRLAASAGIALMPGDAQSPDALLAAADDALRAGKASGKGCVVRAADLADAA